MSTSSEHPSAADLATDGGCVACIGVFDGVHRGHRALIDMARTIADARDLPLVVITFDPHPMAVVAPDRVPTSLATLEVREELLLAAGADAVEVLPFDRSMAAMPPRQFVERVLVGRLNVREVVVGQDFRFGHRAAGTVDTLVAEGRELDFAVTVAPLVGDGSSRWSSTLARDLIAQGDITAAAAVLGRAYRLDGVVVHGDHRGRQLGYPTANLLLTGRPTVPADGVYAGWLGTRDGRHPAAISIGTNPQFAGVERRVEAYALDRDDLDLYGQAVCLEFVERLRGQMRFADVGHLVAQMGDDVDRSRAILSRP